MGRWVVCGISDVETATVPSVVDEHPPVPSGGQELRSRTVETAGLGWGFG